MELTNHITDNEILEPELNSKDIIRAMVLGVDRDTAKEFAYVKEWLYNLPPEEYNMFLEFMRLKIK